MTDKNDTQLEAIADVAANLFLEMADSHSETAEILVRHGFQPTQKNRFSQEYMQSSTSIDLHIITNVNQTLMNIDVYHFDLPEYFQTQKLYSILGSNINKLNILQIRLAYRLKSEPASRRFSGDEDGAEAVYEFRNWSRAGSDLAIQMSCGGLTDAFRLSIYINKPRRLDKKHGRRVNMAIVTVTNIKRLGSPTPEILFIENGLILGWNLDREADVSLDGLGGTVAPAFIELHAHLREPGQEQKEDLASGLAAAAAGGYATVVSMPNTSPVVDDPAIVRTLIERAEALGFARLRPAAALTKGQRGEQLAELTLLRAAGAAMFTDDGRTNEDARVLRLGLEYAGSLGMVVSVHAEDAGLRADGVMHEGTVSEELGLPGNPAAAEAARVARDIEIAALTGARLHLQHLSTARALDLVRAAKARGVSITCEVCPHHLTLTDEALRGFDAMYKVAPPLRTQADADALLDGLRDGTVDCLATDHAPHTRAEKERDLLDAPFGIPSIEVAFALMYTRFGETLGAQTIIELLTSGAAGVMGWPEPGLEPGQPADLVVLDLETEREVNPARFKSKAKFSPWAGEKLRGWPVLTLVGGQVAFQLELTTA